MTKSNAYLQQALDLGDTGGAAHQHNIMHLALVHLGITQALLNWVHALAEQVHAQLLKPVGMCGACLQQTGFEASRLLEEERVKLHPIH
eukprot:scaffold3525_cov18-Tisochrysis_lutea.AAC.4